MEKHNNWILGVGLFTLVGHKARKAIGPASDNSPGRFG